VKLLIIQVRKLQRDKIVREVVCMRFCYDFRHFTSGLLAQRFKQSQNAHQDILQFVKFMEARSCARISQYKQ
jgi:hypothetical protein